MSSTSTTDVPKRTKNYKKIYEKLVTKFQAAQKSSDELFEDEKLQRQSLYLHQRRNNALLDVISQIETSGKLHSPELDYTYEVENSELPGADLTRLENIIALKPYLEHTLDPLLKPNATDVQVGAKLKSLLCLYEVIPELPQDETDKKEVNPQNMAPWLKRNHQDLMMEDILLQPSTKGSNTTNVGGVKKRKRSDNSPSKMKVNDPEETDSDHEIQPSLARSDTNINNDRENNMKRRRSSNLSENSVTKRLLISDTLN